MKRVSSYLCTHVPDWHVTTITCFTLFALEHLLHRVMYTALSQGRAAPLCGQLRTTCATCSTLRLTIALAVGKNYVGCRWSGSGRAARVGGSGRSAAAPLLPRRPLAAVLRGRAAQPGGATTSTTTTVLHIPASPAGSTQTPTTLQTVPTAPDVLGSAASRR